MIYKKLRSRLGMTLAETLTALAVFAILSVVLVHGTNAAAQVYRKNVMVSEAQTLTSTISQSLTDELRYARNIRLDGTVPVFDSDSFGSSVRVSVENGRIKIGTYELLSPKAYTSGLNVQALTVTYTPDSGLFRVEFTVGNAKLSRETEVSVRTMNPAPATQPTAP